MIRAHLTACRRKILAVAAAALSLACGNDASVTNPGPAYPITSVTIFIDGDAVATPVTTPQMTPGTRQIVLRLTDSRGLPAAEPASILWSSSDTLVARVTRAGSVWRLVTLGVGKATIRVDVGTAKAERSLIVIAGTSFSMIFAGPTHTCGMRADDGEDPWVGAGVSCWGNNADGQLGDGTTRDRLTPVPVAGSLKFRTLALGDHHTCGATSDGKLYCWGSNEHGQLGLGDASGSVVPQQVAGITLYLSVMLAAGAEHTCSWTMFGEIGGASESQKLHCWGRNDHGQVGDGTLIDRNRPVFLRKFLAASLTAAGAHTCVADDALEASVPDPAFRCWGENGVGQLGNGSTTDSPNPTRIQLAAKPTRGLTGRFGSCSTVSTGQLYCWGDVSFGAADRIIAAMPKPVGSGHLLMGLGDHHVCAFASVGYPYPQGRLLCMGDNSRGQLGDGTTVSRETFAPVLTSHDARNVSAGHAHTCAMVNLVAMCWGANEHGQLGDGTTIDRATPAAIGVRAP